MSRPLACNSRSSSPHKAPDFLKLLPLLPMLYRKAFEPASPIRRYGDGPGEDCSMKTLLALLLLGALLYWRYAAPGGAGAAVKIAAGNGFVSAETDSTYFEFDISGPLQPEELRVVSFDRNSGVLQQMGFAYAAGFLTAADYQDFQNLTAAKRCPASYLNEHAKRYMLMIPDERLLGEIADAQLDTGDTVRIEGSVMRFAMGEVRGTPLSTFSFGGTVPLYVQQLRFE